jgi:hypothetical protein
METEQWRVTTALIKLNNRINLVELAAAEPLTEMSGSSERLSSKKRLILMEAVRDVD